jgi:hypothetical protein
MNATSHRIQGYGLHKTVPINTAIPGKSIFWFNGPVGYKFIGHTDKQTKSYAFLKLQDPEGKVWERRFKKTGNWVIT